MVKIRSGPDSVFSQRLDPDLNLGETQPRIRNPVKALRIQTPQHKGRVKMVTILCEFIWILLNQSPCNVST